MTGAAEESPFQGPDDPSLLERMAIPLGLVAGCAVYYLMGRALGVEVEVWEGINTFTNPRWFMAVTLAPLLSGFVTGIICGHNGKWLGMVPVLLIHPISYARLSHTVGADYVVLGYGLFIFFMLVMLELALMAGWGGEMIRARRKGDQGTA